MNTYYIILTLVLVLLLIIIPIIIYFTINRKNYSLLFYTKSYPNSNLDSIAFWKRKSKALLFVSAKSEGSVHIYNAKNGKYMGKKIGFKRPNGLLVLNNILYVVDRDSKSVILFSIPDLKEIKSFGVGILQKPYGITGWSHNNKHIIYVTDNFNPGEPSKNRIHKWNIYLPNVKYLGTHGSVLFKTVESIACDKKNNRLLVADEDRSVKKITVLNLKTGVKISSPFDNFKFENDPEGIALLKMNGCGYWITTDQSKTSNKFYVFNRDNLKYKTTLKLKGVSNTDGIAVGKIGNNYTLYVVDNDKRIGAFKINNI